MYYLLLEQDNKLSAELICMNVDSNIIDVEIIKHLATDEWRTEKSFKGVWILNSYPKLSLSQDRQCQPLPILRVSCSKSHFIATLK